MFRSTILLLTAIPLIHAFSVATPGFNFQERSALFAAKDMDESDSTDPDSPIFFVEEEESSAAGTVAAAKEEIVMDEEAVVGDLEEQAVDLFNVNTNKDLPKLFMDNMEEITTKAKDFLESEHVQEISTKAHDLFEDKKVKDSLAKTQDFAKTAWAKFSEILDNTVGQKLRELKEQKEEEGRN